MNKLLATVLVLLAIILIIFAFFGGLWQNKEKIHAAEIEMEKLRSQRDSLQTVVAFRDSLEKIIGDQISSKKDETDALRQEVNNLESEREKNQLTVRNLHKKGDLQEKFEKTFPEVANSDWGVKEVYNEQYKVGVEYFLIPLWFGETFIIDHQNSESYKEQKYKLVQVDSLNQEVISLQDSVLSLERLNKLAYKAGFDSAYSKYEELNQKYIIELQKGKINWGWQVGGIVGGGIIGVLVGRATK